MSITRCCFHLYSWITKKKFSIYWAVQGFSNYNVHPNLQDRFLGSMLDLVNWNLKEISQAICILTSRPAESQRIQWSRTLRQRGFHWHLVDMPNHTWISWSYTGTQVWIQIQLAPFTSWVTLVKSLILLSFSFLIYRMELTVLSSLG